MSEHQGNLLDHEYDGIQELDNQLPRWWLYLFYVTIVWGVLYMLYYHVLGIGYSSADEYREEMDPSYVRVSEADYKILGVIDAYHSPFYSPKQEITPMSLAMGSGEKFVLETRETDTNTYVALTEAADLEAGAAIFTTNCATCHGKLGEGGIGPNLTDDYWIHGAGVNNIAKSIKYGYPAKGMIAWRGFLKEKQIMQAVSYVMKLHGTNPPNAKPPQGDLVTDY